MNNSIKVVTVVQARMSSTRLPFKVMMALAGKPLIFRIIERIKFASESGIVVVATTTDSMDDGLCQYLENEKIEYFRGDPLDLLDRHYQVGMKYEADAVVKIPSDCPLIDPEVINRVIRFYKNNFDKYDFVSNLHPATYPDGNDVEIMSVKALTQAYFEAVKNFEREHTTPYIWENRDKFRLANVSWETGYDYSMSKRWTIDYEEDYLFIKAVFSELYCKNPRFTLYDILTLLEKKPEIEAMNKKFAGVNWYRHHLDDLKTVNIAHTKLF